MRRANFMLRERLAPRRAWKRAAFVSADRARRQRRGRREREVALDRRGRDLLVLVPHREDRDLPADGVRGRDAAQERPAVAREDVGELQRALGALRERRGRGAAGAGAAVAVAVAGRAARTTGSANVTLASPGARSPTRVNALAGTEKLPDPEELTPTVTVHDA